MAESGDKHQRNLNILNEELRKRGLMINFAKTKSMVIAREKATLELKMEDENVQQETVFKYLCSHISEDDKLMEETNSRIGAAGRLYH